MTIQQARAVLFNAGIRTYDIGGGWWKVVDRQTGEQRLTTAELIAYAEGLS